MVSAAAISGEASAALDSSHRIWPAVALAVSDFGGTGRIDVLVALATIIFVKNPGWLDVALEKNIVLIIFISRISVNDKMI